MPKIYKYRIRGGKNGNFYLFCTCYWRYLFNTYFLLYFSSHKIKKEIGGSKNGFFDFFVRCLFNICGFSCHIIKKEIGVIIDGH